MRLLKCLFVIAAATAGYGASAGGREEPTAYGCGDSVVLGRVITTGYTDMSAEEDILGHGVHIGTMTIDRVLRGKHLERKIEVQYYSHAEMQQRQMRFVLIPQKEGFIIRDVTVPPYRKRPLAKNCSPALDGGPA